jgi:uncharacterized protein (DUF302 family)
MNENTPKSAEHPDDGLVTIPSAFSPDETSKKLDALLQKIGVEVFARIDHAAGAISVGMKLPPTRVILFGNPAAGTPLMQSNQKIGIDLPLKILIWQNEAGKVFLTYDDPQYLVARHHITDRAKNVAAMSGLLQKIATGVTSNESDVHTAQ